MLKTSVLLDIYVETIIFFKNICRIEPLEYISAYTVFETEILYNIINVFTVPFNQYIASSHCIKVFFIIIIQ